MSQHKRKNPGGDRGSSQTTQQRLMSNPSIAGLPPRVNTQFDQALAKSDHHLCLAGWHLGMSEHYSQIARLLVVGVQDDL